MIFIIQYSISNGVRDTLFSVNIAAETEQAALELLKSSKPESEIISISYKLENNQSKIGG